MEKKSFVRKIPTMIGVLVCIVLIPILVMNLTIIVKSYMNPDVVPDFLGMKPFIVLTGSMEDTISAGDLVVAKTVDPSSLEVGDIISYKIDESVITHRIIELSEIDGEPAFITQGDANNIEDDKAVTYSQVEGIYYFKISKVGNLAMFMQTPTGMLVFIGIPLVCFVLYDFIRGQMVSKKETKKDEETQAEIERLKAELAKKEEGKDTSKEE